MRITFILTLLIIFSSCTRMEISDSKIISETVTENTNIDSTSYEKSLKDTSDALYNKRLVFNNDGSVYVFEKTSSGEINLKSKLKGEADKEVLDWGLFLMTLIILWFLFKD